MPWVTKTLLVTWQEVALAPSPGILSVDPGSSELLFAGVTAKGQGQSQPGLCLGAGRAGEPGCAVSGCSGGRSQQSCDPTNGITARAVTPGSRHFMEHSHPLWASPGSACSRRWRLQVLPKAGSDPLSCPHLPAPTQRSPWLPGSQSGLVLGWKKRWWQQP